MSYAHIKHFRPDRWLYLFLCVHLILWTLVPALVRYNLPLDSIEGTIWGHQLEWGYDKNPYLNGWLTALATFLDGHSGWMVYLFSQICVITCLWAMWRLAKNIVPPVYALISVLLLESVQYFNFHAIDFNDNTLELCFWALAIYCFYKALRSSSGKMWIPFVSSEGIAWILTGIFAGLGMMAKYYTVTLIAGMALFLVIPPHNRKRLATLPPYLGLTAFILVCFPHIVWLFSHDFITVRYVIDRGSSVHNWTDNFIYPAEFIWQQLEAFLPAIVPCALLFAGKKPLIAPTRFKVDSFNKLFLFYIAGVPFLLTILISLILGTKLRAGWGMPLLSTWGIILIAAVQPNITKVKIAIFLIFNFILLGAQVSGYSLALAYSSTPTSANFPGREIAGIITQQWRDAYHTKLDYVGGSRWISGNISFYSPDHPAVFVEWNEQRAPWINMLEMHKKGAVFVWEITQSNELPEEIQKKYPQLKNVTVMDFNWHRNNKNIAPVKIGVAILPPSA